MSCVDCAQKKTRQPAGHGSSTTSGMVQTTPRGGMPPTRTGTARHPRSAITDAGGNVLVREPCDDTVACGAHNELGIPGCCASGDSPVGSGVQTSRETPVPGSEHATQFTYLEPASAGVLLAVLVGLVVLGSKS